MVATDRSNDATNGGPITEAATTSSTINGSNRKDQLEGSGETDILSAMVANDTNTVGDGNDTPSGGDGDDILTGGAGTDLFVFHSGGYGQDTVTESNASADQIELAIGLYDNFQDLQPHMQEVAQDVVTTISDAEAVTLQKVTLADLDPNDFTIF
jgi:Ca2+-binding RTX toxin-like protein